MRLIPVIMIAFALVVLISCDKDKFETKPFIEVKDYSTKTVPFQGELVIRINYFDKEGDLGKGELYLLRERTNRIPPNPQFDQVDSLRYPLPDFVDKGQGEIRLVLRQVDFLGESATQNDTMFFKIAVTDRAGNTSDTLITDQVVALFQ
jgi:hypothetical protein